MKTSNWRVQIDVSRDQDLKHEGLTIETVIQEALRNFYEDGLLNVYVEKETK